jgi:hypothetical protein
MPSAKHKENFQRRSLRPMSFCRRQRFAKPAGLVVGASGRSPSCAKHPQANLFAAPWDPPLKRRCGLRFPFLRVKTGFTAPKSEAIEVVAGILPTCQKNISKPQGNKTPNHFPGLTKMVSPHRLRRFPDVRVAPLFTGRGLQHGILQYLGSPLKGPLLGFGELICYIFPGLFPVVIAQQNSA